MEREVNLEMFDNKFRQSIDLLINGSVQEAKKLFLECLSFDIEYMEKLFGLISDTIYSKDFSKVFLYFDLVIASGKDKYIRDVKFYLYLINYIDSIPRRFRELINNLSYEDIKVDEDDERYDLPDVINRVRDCALRGEPADLESQGSYRNHFRINYLLWLRFRGKVRKFSRKLREFKNLNDYNTMIDLISEEEKRRNLSKGLIRLKKLAGVIRGIKKGIMPKTSTKVVDNEDDAIEIGNFQLAYQLRWDRKKENGTLEKKDGILQILSEIIGLLDRKPKQDSDVSFDDLFNKLITGVPSYVKQGLELLPSYLNSIGKSEYVDLMSELIKMCLLEQEKGYDVSFLGPLYRLAQLKQFGRIELDILLYESYAMLAFDNGDMDFAYKYVEIILRYIDIVDSEINLSKLDLTELRKRLSAMLHNIYIYNKGAIPHFKYLKVDIEDYYYGIFNIDSIMRAIENTNLDIRSACRVLGIDSEMMNFIILIYAKNSYSCGFYEHGDKCLMVVEKNKNKSQQLILALRDVRARKRFYASSTPVYDLSNVKLLKP